MSELRRAGTPATGLSRRLRGGEPSSRVGFGCSLAGAYNVVGQVLDSVVVMHADSGCVHLNLANHFSTDLRGLAFEPAGSALRVAGRLVGTGLTQREVVFGGEAKLAAAIIDADRRFKPKLITVLTACVADLIGDDVLGVIAETRPKVAARVIAVSSGGICTGSFDAGMTAAYRTLIEELVPGPQPREPRVVNVLAEKNLYLGEEREFAEIARLLGGLGARVGCRLVRRVTTTEMARAGAAALNLPRDRDYGIVLARQLEQATGVPYLDRVYPTGRVATREWLIAVGEALELGAAARELVAVEESRYRERLELARSSLAGKRLVVVAGAANPGWIVELALDLGLIVTRVCFLGESEPSILAALAEAGVPATQAADAEAALAEARDLGAQLVLVPYGLARAIDGAAVRSLPSLPPTGYTVLNEAETWARLARRPEVEGWRRDADWAASERGTGEASR